MIKSKNKTKKPFLWLFFVGVGVKNCYYIDMKNEEKSKNDSKTLIKSSLNTPIATSELEVKKSKFLAFRYDLTAVEEVEQILTALRREHKKARHFCYAYVYSRDMVVEKCSDDKEPSGTAGYPILNVIKKKELTNTLVVVVRYFGGIKLGAGGLTRAYTKAASSVLMIL